MATDLYLVLLLQKLVPYRILLVPRQIVTITEDEIPNTKPVILHH